MTAVTHELPGVAVLRFPLSRSRTLLLFVAISFIFLGLDTFLAHVIDGALAPGEWIPIVHGPLAGLAVLWIVFRPKPRPAEHALLGFALVSAVVVGVMGTAFHWQRALLARSANTPNFLEWLIFAPPAAGPSAFVGIALIGLIASLHEEERDSGRMDFWGLARFQAPLTKTQILLGLVGLGYASALFSSTLDHARGGFANPASWVALVTLAFATAITLGRAAVRQVKAADHTVYFWTQIAMIAIGLLGFGLHLSADLTTRGEISLERLLSHAPVMAPLLLCNLGLLGLICVLRPVEDKSER